jgi:hypothetical protein
MNDYEWMENAACRGCDPNLFFPQKGQHIYTKMGKLICETCKVKSECLDFAERYFITSGTWGGCSPKARRRRRHDQPIQLSDNTERQVVRLASNKREFHERDHNPERASEATRAVG